MTILSRTEREEILKNVTATVEAKHFDPQFNREKWRSAIQQSGESVLGASEQERFDSALDDVVRSVGTPDAGFFHESTRKKVPKGIAARFQYCQPNECAPVYTQPTDAGDVFISKIVDRVGWLKVTKFPGAVGVDIAKQIDHAIKELNGCDRLIIDLRGETRAAGSRS